MRRQNHSCDYCRKSKKACDGFARNQFLCRSSNSGSPSSATADSQPYGRLLPCSYCVRTKKECSLNPNWGRAASPSATASFAERPEDHCEPLKRQKSHQDSQSTSTLDYDLELSLEDISDAIHGRVSNRAPVHNASTPGFQSIGDAQLSEPEEPGSRINVLYPEPRDASHIHDDSIGPEPWICFPSHASPWHNMDLISLTDRPAPLAPQTDFQSWPWPSDNSHAHESTESSFPSSQSDCFTHLGKRKASLTSHVAHESSLSVYSTGHVISAAANNHLIIGNLLGIYHDVLENNLACWLAEENCPYKMQHLAKTSSMDSQLTCSNATNLSPRGSEEDAREWGRDWSNRIYRRVTQLDRMAVRSKQIKLSRAQSHAASRALSLVIMAFAAQWSQDRDRHSMPPPRGADLGETETTFERHLQQSVWRQAKHALHDVADVESFRVAYAEMVFGLMEKPWDDDDDETSEIAASDDTHKMRIGHIQSKVLDVLAEDGPPVVLERAARKMQVLKFKFEFERTNFLPPSTILSSQRKNISDEDRETVGLLYWLAVMFDTVSSPMNERPVALDDEECQHDAARERQSQNAIGEKPTDSRSHLRWNVQTFTRGNESTTERQLYWPCSHDKAADAIARSAPIKVLIFRHLSYLQNILRRKHSGQPTEDALWEATLVYRYWNTVYAGFYRDLVQNYESVPTRIRAWFVCIYVPWHLACLMLADVVEVVDQSGFGLKENSCTRAKAGMVSRIRTQSAYELSELARVTTPADGAYQLPDYHHAVSEGPLLTEPWTVLLVRAFAKSALFYLEAARILESEAGSIPGHQSDAIHDHMTRAGYCNGALISLGKKSTMARHIARLLHQVLND